MVPKPEVAAAVAWRTHGGCVLLLALPPFLLFSLPISCSYDSPWRCSARRRSLADPPQRPPRQSSMQMLHGAVILPEAEVFSIKPDLKGIVLFPSKEICITHISPASEQSPPLAILQTIAPFSVRCKLQAKPLRPHPSCFNEYRVLDDSKRHVQMSERTLKIWDVCK